jgi:hypothetical protein
VITLQWKFLLSVPIVGRYHEYQIVIKIDGTVNDPEFFSLPIPFELIAGPAVELSIDYVDYVVARSFQTAIDEWASSLHVRKTSALLKNLRKRVDEIRMFAPKLAMLSSLFSAQAWWSITSQFTNNDSFQLALWATFMVATLLASLTLCQAIVRYVLTPAQTLDNCGIIKINKGDQKNFTEITQRVQHGPVRAMGTIILLAVQLAINVASSAIYAQFSGPSG